MAPDILRAMTDTLVHRGPDDEGWWWDHEVGVYLGFRRLAILDLSDAGHQPMVSGSGRFVMVFNGEIYNFRDLQEELELSSHSLRGGSDTEVLLAAMDRWGPEATLPRLQGMFALAVWDCRERSLVLARDRLGIKPLFVSASGSTVVFGSELRALIQHPQVERRGDPEAAWHYLRNLYVPAPLSILAGVQKVLPGTALRFDLGGNRPSQPEIFRYWDISEQIGKRSEILEDPKAASDELRSILRASVKQRMVADVPVGALLSGGIDSSLVVALMQEQASEAVRTFTIRFDDPRFDEGPIASEVANHLGTVHTEVPLSQKQAMEMVPSLPEISDEPMANPSLLPTLLVCEVARREVVVALSGDGGDEVFGGYNRYVQARQVFGLSNRFPDFLRRGMGRGFNFVAERGWAEPFGSLWQPERLGPQHSFSSRLGRLGRLLDADDRMEAYRQSMAVGWVRPPLQPPASRMFRSDRATAAGPTGILSRMMLHDQLQYLPDDLLAKVDRASMQVSLEARVPILDHRVVEFSWGLSEDLKVRDGVTKWILRQLVSSYLPSETFDRPKMGFTVPVAQWLRGELAPWVEDTLQPTSMRARGLYDIPTIEEFRKRFNNGRGDLGLPLWTMCVLEDWCKRWGVEFG